MINDYINGDGLDLVRKHIEWAKKNDCCAQCMYPWHDGICECNNWDRRMDLVANIAYKLIEDGEDVDKQLGDQK